MWDLLLFDVTLKHMLYCSRNVHRTYTDQDAKSLLQNKTHLSGPHFLSFQDHTFNYLSKTTKCGQHHSKIGTDMKGSVYQQIIKTAEDVIDVLNDIFCILIQKFV